MCTIHKFKSSPLTDLWWHWGRGCSRQLAWKRWRPRQRASWRKTLRQKVWARRRDCCSCCCVSLQVAKDPSGWGRAHNGPDGRWLAWHSCYWVGTWALRPCPLYSWHNPSSSLQERQKKTDSTDDDFGYRRPQTVSRLFVSLHQCRGLVCKSPTELKRLGFLLCHGEELMSQMERSHDIVDRSLELLQGSCYSPT